MLQTTLVLLKPDCVQRNLMGQVIARFEAKGLTILGMKMMQLDDALINEHYGFLADKPFFPAIVSYMKSSPIVAMAIRGANAVPTIRTMSGATNPVDALPGTIRGDFALSIDGNIMHASDSLETANEELKRFFKEGEIFDYERLDNKVL
ncbi:MAG: nucleoside-diphosphate kinase [Candidatus Gracilibacteria bacterium]|nr:nucleoside-diphosphate kinase [Candidatus Gracilibacteria bacterium]